ncbi:MAG: helix-turn-helix domain-containing protein [Bacillales bacterium]|nr:helix-turn-helix domain-containing protein [Bacillales bacterium]
MNIVVIDDERIIANAFYKMISHRFPSCLVKVFYKSNELLKYSETNKIDVLVCDIDMPLINGIDLAKTLKERIPDLQILFLTGMDTFDYIYKATKIRDSKYILKIEEESTIINTIQELINVHAQIDKQHTEQKQLVETNDNLLNEKYHAILYSSLFDNDLINEIDVSPYHFHLIISNKQLNEDLFNKIKTIIINRNISEDKLIFQIDDFVFGLLSSNIIAKSLFDEISQIAKKQYDVILNIVINEEKNQINKYKQIYNQMCEITSVTSSTKGYYYLYSNNDNKVDEGIKLIETIRNYVYEHTSEDISLRKISEVIHYNESYLSRLFKQLTGKNYKDLVTEIKINKSINLLTKTDMMAKDIAKAVGFESTSHFQYFFKKNKGVTPLEFRRNINSNK